MPQRLLTARNIAHSFDCQLFSNIDFALNKKVYVDKKRVRIVYKIVEDKVVVYLVAIGKRNDMEVYEKASWRVE